MGHLYLPADLNRNLDGLTAGRHLNRDLGPGCWKLISFGVHERKGMAEHPDEHLPSERQRQLIGPAARQEGWLSAEKGPAWRHDS